jgi:hypothetical protein
MNARGAPSAAPSIAQQKSRGAPLLGSPRINTKPIIYLNINVLQLSEINTVAQQFSCEFVLRGWSSGLKGARAWVDPTLAAPTNDDPRWNDESYIHRPVSPIPMGCELARSRPNERGARGRGGSHRRRARREAAPPVPRHGAPHLYAVITLAISSP